LAFGGGGSSTPETIAHTHNAALAGDGGDLSETLTDMNGVSLYSLITDNSAAVAANTVNIAANTAAIAAIASVPSGVILMWSGSVVSIPAGWDLCDGTSGTVNLSNKFVRSGTSIGTTGGADTVTLTGAESGLVSHTHSSSVSDGGHTHTGNTRGTTNSGNGASQAAISSGPSYSFTTSSSTTGISVSVGTVGASAASSAHENMPAYYELAYIQKS
jgi:microcystin-dependent protein